jgi:hypothetical protein
MITSAPVAAIARRRHVVTPKATFDRVGQQSEMRKGLCFMVF